MSNFDPHSRDLSKFQKVMRRLFPERQMVLRSAEGMSSLRLTTGVQGTAVAAVVLVLGWTCFSSFMYLNADNFLASKQEDVARAQAAEKALLARVVEYQKQLVSLSTQLEENHQEAVQASLPKPADANKPGDKAAAETAVVRQARQEALLEETTRRRQLLLSQLENIQAGLGAISATALPSAGTPEALEAQVRQLLVSQEVLRKENDSLRSLSDGLQSRIVEMNATQMTLVQRFSSVVKNRSSDIENALSGTGLKLDDLKEKQSSAQGGPFIPLASWPGLQHGVLGNGLANLAYSFDQWEKLRGVSDVLPIVEPVQGYHLGSSFGPRRDPFNGDTAFHAGLDMVAPVMTPVKSTAPGKVAFAGWRGRYGRLVEIDHGNGLKTRYGHLQKIAVRKGERVDRSSVVGLVGSSGRSTGPHLHYEVVVNGEPRNPSIFIKAGANVL